MTNRTADVISTIWPKKAAGYAVDLPFIPSIERNIYRLSFSYYEG